MTTLPRSCLCCQVARQHPTYQFFSLACVYCGARLIQNLGTLQIRSSQCTERRKAVLVDWVAHGHSESQLRSLAKGAHCIGPD
jgi:hypothetical protein